MPARSLTRKNGKLVRSGEVTSHNFPISLSRETLRRRPNETSRGQLMPRRHGAKRDRARAKQPARRRRNRAAARAAAERAAAGTNQRPVLQLDEQRNNS